MSTADLLAGVWLFQNASRESLEKLAAFAFDREFKAGDVIVTEGQTGNGIYIVSTGKVDVIKGLETANPQTLATLATSAVVR